MYNDGGTLMRQRLYHALSPHSIGHFQKPLYIQCYIDFCGRILLALKSYNIILQKLLTTKPLANMTLLSHFIIDHLIHYSSQYQKKKMQVC